MAEKSVIPKNWFTKESLAAPAESRMTQILTQTKIMRSEDLPELLTSKEVAPILKVHHKTAADMMRDGTLRSVKIRGRRFTTPQWIADFLRKELRYG